MTDREEAGRKKPSDFSKFTGRTRIQGIDRVSWGFSPAASSHSETCFCFEYLDVKGADGGQGHLPFRTGESERPGANYVILLSFHNPCWAGDQLQRILFERTDVFHAS